MDPAFYPFWPSGYRDLGPNQVPPDALWVGMTDRDTGAVWYMGFDPCFDGRICLVSEDEIPYSKSLVTRVYGPYDGPYIGAYGLRLGIRDGHLVFDQIRGSGGALPAAFDKAGNHQLWLQLYAVAHSNPNNWDHLAYDGAPSVFFGLTDQEPYLILTDEEGNWLTTETGALLVEPLPKVRYIALDHNSGHIIILDNLNVPNVVRSRIKVYPPFDGPPIGTSALRFFLRNGRIGAEIGPEQAVLIPTMAYDSHGDLSQAALFAGANINGQFGIADQPPDHVAYSVVNPIINECTGGPSELEEFLVDEDGEISLV